LAAAEQEGQGAEAPSPGRGNMPDQLKSGDAGWTPAVSASDTTASSPAPPPPGHTRPLLSADADFGDVSRGTPVPHSLTGAALEAAGLTPDRWTCSVSADGFVDPPHCKLPAVVEKEFTLDLAQLKRLGREHGTVKIVKAMQCLNGESPLGQGLWEGVALATVLRQCGRMANVRRVNYWGDPPDGDPRQVFRSSISYTEAFEPAAGDPPVMLAWALNGEPLSLERGGPVRMVVPHAHGFKSVKCECTRFLAAPLAGCRLTARVCRAEAHQRHQRLPRRGHLRRARPLGQRPRQPPQDLRKRRR